MTPEPLDAPTAPAARSAPFPPLTALFLAVVFVSSSAILIRFTEAAPLAVAGWRLALAAALLLLLPQARAGWRDLDPADARRMALAALCLAVHFGAWIASLRLLPVSVSVVLVSTHPLFVLAFRTFAGELPRFVEIAGITLALVGMATMQLFGKASPEPVMVSTYTVGVVLALTGAAALAAYLILGSGVRRRVRTTSYLVLVYGLAAIALFGFLLGAGGIAVPSRTQEFSLYLLLALGPTIGGHGLFAYAVGHMRPVIVSAAFLAEPIVATLLAIPIFHEVPTTRVLVGGALVLFGLALVITRPANVDG